MDRFIHFIRKYWRCIPTLLLILLMLFALISCTIVIGKKISIFIGTCGLIATIIMLGQCLCKMFKYITKRND